MLAAGKSPAAVGSGVQGEGEPTAVSLVSLCMPPPRSMAGDGVGRQSAAVLVTTSELRLGQLSTWISPEMKTGRTIAELSLCNKPGRTDQSALRLATGPNTKFGT